MNIYLIIAEEKSTLRIRIHVSCELVNTHNDKIRILYRILFSDGFEARSQDENRTFLSCLDFLK